MATQPPAVADVRPVWASRRFSGAALLTTVVLLSHAVLVGATRLPAQDVQSWSAGQWDVSGWISSATLHPRTVAIRVQLVDARTYLPVAGIRVSLVGEFQSQLLSTSGPVSSELEQFRLDALTGADGVAVFALRWSKDYPWNLGRPLQWSVGTTWRRSVDDIEKVQRIEVRSARTIGVDLEFNFERLFRVGQDERREQQLLEVVERFEESLRAEYRSASTHVCYIPPDLGRGLGLGPGLVTRNASLFDAVRRRVCHATLSPSGSGPYFVYEVRALISRIR